MGAMYLDIQGFTSSDKIFVVKEIAILRENKKFQHFIFAPPHPWSVLSKESRQQALESKMIHGFNWNDGYIPYEKLRLCIEPILKNRSEVLLVLNKTMQLLVKKLFNLDSAYLSKLLYSNPPSHLQPRCDCHFGTCAIENVFTMRNKCFM